MAMAATRALSDYFKTLDAKCGERYLMKLADINGDDPYSIHSSEYVHDFSLLPKITYPDLVNYLVFTKSFYTSEDFKAYKSLEAYNQFACGWVRHFGVKKYGNKYLLLGKVCHSQSFNVKPLEPWVIADDDGSITSAHCTCMAGLAEACTHIGALLFFVEFGVRHTEESTVTQQLAYWPVPAAKEVPYSRIKDIDFSTPKKKCEKLEGSLPVPSKRLTAIPEPTEEEIVQLSRDIFQTGVKSAFLSVKAGYEEFFKPKPALISPTIDLRSLHNTDLYDHTQEQLISLSLNTVISITSLEAVKIEQETRHQSDCKLWFQLRAGRITASKFKLACCTKSPTSSPSLIKSICYPESVKFRNNATDWGCTHEKTAREVYQKSAATSHEGSVVSTVGLLIHPEYPFFGASPDALLQCNCCGEGVLEIKCPYCIKDKVVEELPSLKGSCLEVINGTRKLKRNHAYFYQVQAQLFISGKAYADFMVWTNTGEPHLERIYPDFPFWEAAVSKATKFFREGIMLELLAKFISRGRLCLQPLALANISTEADESRIEDDIEGQNDDKIWCVCNGKLDNDQPMIFCENEMCLVQWYHFECLKFKCVPKGKFVCPACKPKRKRKVQYKQ